MSEDPVANGLALFQSADYLRRASREMDALMESLKEMLGASDIGEIGEVEDHSEATGWITTIWDWNADILAPKQKGQKKQRYRGSVSLSLRLCNTTDMGDIKLQWPWLTQACLIVGWHNFEDRNDESYWYGTHYQPVEGGTNIQHKKDGLWVWHDDEQDWAHFFALPLFSLRSEDDLKTYAIEPLNRLFENSEATDALTGVPALKPPAAP